MYNVIVVLQQMHDMTGWNAGRSVVVLLANLQWNHDAIIRSDTLYANVFPAISLQYWTCILDLVSLYFFKWRLIQTPGDHVVLCALFANDDAYLHSSEHSVGVATDAATVPLLVGCSGRRT